MTGFKAISAEDGQSPSLPKRYTERNGMPGLVINCVVYCSSSSTSRPGGAIGVGVPAGVRQAVAVQRISGKAKSDSCPCASTEATELKKLSPCWKPSSPGETARNLTSAGTEIRLR